MADKTILVVEDDSDARELLNMMLETLGYQVVAFESGSAALEKVADLDIHLAMLDVMMPEMNGYELLEKLKEIDALTDIPIVMVTAKDQDDDVMTGYQHGADYYITKPYTMNQIKYALDLYLENSVE